MSKRSGRNNPKQTKAKYAFVNPAVIETETSEPFEPKMLKGNVTSFVMSEDNREKAKNAVALGNLGTARGHLEAGEMFIELASNIARPIARKQLIDSAKNNWKACLDVSAESDPHTLRANIQLAHVPVYKNLLVDNFIPTWDTASDVYKSLVDLGSYAKDIFDKEDISGRRSHLIGTAAELAVLALLHRCSARNMLAEWAIVPSFLSEDQDVDAILSQGATAPRNAWDVSVYGQNSSEASPMLRHKIQVKSRHDENESAYDEEVRVVHLQQDLSLSTTPRDRWRSGFSPFVVMSECFDELYPPNQSTLNFASRTLDLRTGKLLDILQIDH